MLDKINEDLKVAMKSADKFQLSVLRMLKSALQLESINKKHDLSDDEVLSVIKKQVKQRTDSKSEFLKYEKYDKVEDLEKEIAILNNYLPLEMSEDEINIILDQVFASVKPESIKEMGKVMKEVQPLLTGKNADMALVSKLIRERLS
jgi:uncharacterized protein